MIRLFSESVRTALAQPVPSVVTGLIVAAVCSVIISATGETVQAERRVLGEIDAAGTRSVVIVDTKGMAGITPEAVERIAGLSGVEWVFGLGPASDVHAAGNPGSAPAAVRAVHGELPPVVAAERLLVADRVLVGPEAQKTLGLIHPYGGVVGDDVGDFPVLGGFVSLDPVGFLDRGLLRAAGPDDTVVRSIHILTLRPEDVAGVTDASLMVLAPEDPSSVGVETSEALAAIRSAVQGELGSYGRRLITIVLVVGLVLVGLNVYGTVTTRRRDFGRRRALGASRPQITALVALQTFTTAAIGAAVGTVGTVAVTIRLGRTPPDAEFALAIAVLAVVVTTLAAIPPAVVAAYRDPVRVLRIP